MLSFGWVKNYFDVTMKIPLFLLTNKIDGYNLQSFLKIAFLRKKIVTLSIGLISTVVDF